jgi:peptidoglycan/xylan/chitin deacetylase (PgdA/CDA1 family)
MAVRFVERIFPQWLWRLPSASKSVALTFDDGPHPDTTPALLTTLKQLRIPATHFILGSRAQNNSQLVEAIHAAGHTIGSHGFNHVSFAFKPPSFQRETIHKTNETVFNILHEQLCLFRPPYGHFNPFTSTVLQQMEQRGVMWSLHARDWKNQSGETLWERIKSGLHEGAIIVLHDGHPTTAATIRILPRLADEISRRGWSFTALDSKALSTLTYNT